MDAWCDMLNYATVTRYGSTMPPPRYLLSKLCYVGRHRILSSGVIIVFVTVLGRPTEDELR